MIVDAHQHFWTLSRGDYPWPNASVAPIYKDFGPTDLAPLLQTAGVNKTVIVQATDTVAETDFILEIAGKTDWVAGVVGWVDLSAEDAIETIDKLGCNPALKGLRPMLQNVEDTNWILQDKVQPALVHMGEVGLCFDALIQPRHLAAIHKVAMRHPDLKIVVDHVAKPAMGDGQRPDPAWLSGMTKLAEMPNVHCKLSGMVTEIGPDWQFADLAPFAEHVLARFGPEKTIFGSDWPVVTLASSYKIWRQTVDRLLSDYTETERAQIMGGNAMSFYNLSTT